MEDDLRTRFALAEITATSRPRRDAAACGFTGEQHPLAVDLPLDVRATAFQRRVWTALRAIPEEETVVTFRSRPDRPAHGRSGQMHACASIRSGGLPSHRVIGAIETRATAGGGAQEAIAGV